jgi:hypothetical protein
MKNKAGVKEFVPAADYQQRERDTEKGTCTRKPSYPTEKVAREAANRISRRDGTLVTHYQCRFCNLYHHTKADGGALELPETYGDMPVFFDTKGPYLKVQVTCSKCGKSEPGTKRVSVVDGVYTRAQGTALDDPTVMMHPPKGSKKLWVHAGECPTQEEHADEVLDSENVHAAEQLGAISPAGEHEGKGPDVHSKSILDITRIDNDVILDLGLMLDPKNKEVSAEFARGAAWLFLRLVTEAIMKH